MKNSIQLTLILALAATLFSAHCRADRDIVYSARYYYPPGTKTDTTKTRSRFHLYRINPDGSGKTQITNGRFDDRRPKWSVDGKYIYFLRTTLGNFNDNRNEGASLWRCNASGKNQTIIFNGTDKCIGDVKLSPSGKYLGITLQDMTDTDHLGDYAIVLKTTGKLVKRIANCSQIEWSPTDDRLRAHIDHKWWELDMHGPKRYEVKLNGLVGLASSWSGSWLDFASMSAFEKMNIAEGRTPNYTQLPIDNPNVAYCLYLNGTSGHRPAWEIMKFNQKTGAYYNVCNGQYLGWNKDRSWLLSSTCRDYGNYDGRRHLCMSKLVVKRDNVKDWKPIVTGNVWVETGDWRFGGRVP